MFHPELGAAGALVVLEQVLFTPGITASRSEEKRIITSVRSGTADNHTMAPLLRWLRGERATRELSSRGLKFVGPYTEEVLPPITTRTGMTHLIKEVGNVFSFIYMRTYACCSLSRIQCIGYNGFVY